MREIILALSLVGVCLPSSTLGQEATKNAFAFILTKDDYEDALKRNEYGRQEKFDIELAGQTLNHSTFNATGSQSLKGSASNIGAFNLTTSISSSRWQGEIALRILPGTSPGNYFVDANLVSLKANIPNVSTTGSVLQRSGSVKTRIRVNGSCKGAQVNSIQGMRVSAELNWKVDQNQIVSNTRKFQVLKSPLVQGLEFQSCTGFSGYASEVRKALIGFLQTPESLQRWMEPFIKTKLRESLATLQKHLLLPRTLALSASQNLLIFPGGLSFDEKSGSFVLEGSWRIAPSNSKLDNSGKLAANSVVSPSRKPSSLMLSRRSSLLSGVDLGSGGSRWIFKSEELRKAVVTTFQPEMLKIEKKALEVPGLKKVLGSRWVQSVAWPDLHNFPLLTDFKTVTNMAQLSKLVPDGFINGYQKINYAMESLWRTRWSFPNDQEYMKWNYQAKWKLGLAVVFGALEVSFDQVALNLSVDSQRGKKALNRKLIEKELTKAIGESRFYVPLPPIDLQSWGYFYPSHFTQAGETISLHYFPY